MRRCYLVCYDIRHPRRLRRVHRVLTGYGSPWQYSVFFCVLGEIDWVHLQTDLKREMNLREDQALIIDLGADEKKVRSAATVVGQPLLGPEGSIVVI